MRVYYSYLLSVLAIAALFAADAPELPLKVSSNGRYLVDQKDHPVFLQGDSPWSLISGLTKEETEHYLEDRRQKGFNALIVNLIEHKFRGPVNRYSERPFTTPGDFTRPNDKYFAHADWMLKSAAEKGIVVLLAPMYLGFRGSDEGWYQEVRLNGEAKCREYGRYLGKRYKDYKNIVWLLGGDRNPQEVRKEVDSLAAGIREYIPGQLFTAHTGPEHTPVEEYCLSDWVDLNTTYTYMIVHQRLLENYHRHPARPNLLIESTYEGEHNASPLQIRRQAYYALLSGAAGQFFGNLPLWGFFPKWEEALNSRGNQDMARLAHFVASRPWQDLVPDDEHRVVTSGLGEFNGMDYLAAARTANRQMLITYLPTSRAFTVQLGELAGNNLRAWWFNPRDGTNSQAGNYTARGDHEFRTPSEGDWVLVVEDESTHLSGRGQAAGGTQ